MTKMFMTALQGMPRRISSPYIFTNDEGEPYKRVVKGFRAACKRAGIENFRFHDLRHSFASHLIMEGVDIRTVQELLGHKTIAMTLRYTHLIQSHLHNAVGVIDKVFGGTHADDLNRLPG